MAPFAAFPRGGLDTELTSNPILGAAEAKREGEVSERYDRGQPERG